MVYAMQDHSVLENRFKVLGLDFLFVYYVLHGLKLLLYSFFFTTQYCIFEIPKYTVKTAKAG
jgi:hypothetical protein